MKNGATTSTRFGVADAIVTKGLGSPELWITPAPDGLADLYEYDEERA